MGQRLVISVYNNKYEDMPLAKIYYHWSAFSISALIEAKKFIEAYSVLDEYEDDRLRIIKTVENIGGGIRGGVDDSEYDAIKALFPNEEFKTDNYSRNDGLVAITEEGMGALQMWSEGDIFIFLDEKEICSEVFWTHFSLESYNENLIYNELQEVKVEDIPKVDIDFRELKFEDIENAINELHNLDGYVFQDSEGFIFELIA